VKSPERIADEMEFCYQNFGSRFIWLTDDNFGSGERARRLTDELLRRDIRDDLMWFVQWRCDDVVENSQLLGRMRKAGLRWVLLGVESQRQTTLRRFRKGIKPETAKKAVKLLRDNDIFAQVMLIIGDREDTAESITDLREFVKELDPDFAIFAILTPFPGTKIFEEAKRMGWIEDFNWSHYDMIHAIMPTETLSRKEVQEELYKCYRSFYGSWKRRLSGLFSRREMKRRVYWYMASRGIVKRLRTLF
jgi:anaerobic magnesium-protoporphyrin IX monomethyl ester cyclase